MPHTRAVPEAPVVNAKCQLALGCGGLLVGDTLASATWPAKLRPVPPELEGVCDSITVSLQVGLPGPGLASRLAAARARGLRAACTPQLRCSLSLSMHMQAAALTRPA